MSNSPLEVASSASRWLEALIERIPSTGDTAVRAQCRALVASWIASQIAGGAMSAMNAFLLAANRTAQSLALPQNAIHVDNLAPTLKLLVEIILASQGLHVASCREFLAQTMSILAVADPVLEADPCLTQKRVLLYQVGALPMPGTTPPFSYRTLSSNFRLSAPAGVVEAMTLELECLTGWGTRQIDDGAITPEVATIVAGLAVHRLRGHELMPAARLLRLLEYLAAQGIGERRADLGRNLLLHRRSHGPFGWFGPEAAKLQQLTSRSDGGDDRGLLADVELYLPVTLDFLWTIAERSMNGWRLFEQLPLYEPDVSPTDVLRAQEIGLR